MTTDVQDSLLNGVGLSTVLGRLTGVTSDGTPLVNFPGNDEDPVPARSTVTILAEAATSMPEVLLAFPAGPDRPVSRFVTAISPSTPSAFGCLTALRRSSRQPVDSSSPQQGGPPMQRRST